MRAVLCPGQGAQRPGMLAPWLEVEGATSLLEEMSGAAGLDLLTLGTSATAEDLRATEVTQPLVVATSLLSAHAAGLLGPAGAEADLLVTGHSLGSLTALALASALTPVEAVALAAVRGAAMGRCAASCPGTMVALVGGDRDEVLAAVRVAGLTAANVNGSAQVVASGRPEEVAALRPPQGTRSLPLAVGGAFHSPVMEPAVAQVAAAAEAVPRRRLTRALIDDADGALHPAGEDTAAVLGALAGKVTRPVRWDLVQEALLAAGTTQALELAPAGVLAGLARRDLAGVAVARLRSPQDAAALAG